MGGGEQQRRAGVARAEPRARAAVAGRARGGAGGDAGRVIEFPLFNSTPPRSDSASCGQSEF